MLRAIVRLCGKLRRMFKLVLFLGFALIATMLASCSSAPAGSTVSIAAKLLWGLVDGQKLMIYGMGIGQVHQLDASTYEFDMQYGKVTYKLSEPSPCHVETVMQMSSQTAHPPGVTISTDFTKVSQIVVQADTGSGAEIGKKVDLNVVWVKFSATSRDFIKPSLPLGYLFTSLTPDDFQADAAQLQRACATPASPAS